MTYTVHEADVLEVLRGMPDNSFHGCLTDPPYGLTTDGGKTGFMGHAWDKGVPPVEVWREVLRVLKPGAYLLSFGGTRTFHRLTCAIEDAGFEIRDSIAEFFDQDAATQAFLAGLSPAQRKDFDRAFVGSPIECYLYGSGFPKSHDVSKAIDRKAGAAREVVGPDPQAARRNRASPQFGGSAMNEYDPGYDGPLGRMAITAPATKAARQWSGYGTSLKPAFEPVIIARKPLDGTVAQNVQAHGCGGLAIDACRVPGVADKPGGKIRGKRGFDGTNDGPADMEAPDPNPRGRWPANVILTHHPDCVEAGTREVVSLGGHGGVDRGENRKSYSGGYKVQAEATGVGTTKDGTKCMRQETVTAYECVDGCPVKALDAQSGNRKSASNTKPSTGGTIMSGLSGEARTNGYRAFANGNPYRGEEGGASRFFYCAKASRKERDAGLDRFEPSAPAHGYATLPDLRMDREQVRNNPRNVHPTVKPLALTTYLARLILPPVEGTRLLTPFCGSGSEMIGALQAGWSHVEGIDSWDVAVRIARARLAHHEAQVEPANDEQLTLEVGA